MYDVVIIGAGPVGLFAAFSCELLSMRAVILESSNQIGGRLVLYPEKYLYDIPGFEKILAKNLISNLLKQVQYYSVPIHLNHKVIKINKDGIHYFSVATANNVIFQSKAIILATGHGMNSPRQWQIDGVSEVKNKILYSLENIDKMNNKNVAIIGGGDSALDYTHTLSPICKMVYLLHRGNKFRGLQSTLENIKKLNNCKIHTSCIVRSITYSKALLQLYCHNGDIIHVDYVFPCLGVDVDASFTKIFTLKSKRGKILVNPTTMQTYNHESELRQNCIYAIGDAIIFDNKINLIACGFSEAFIATHQIKQSLGEYCFKYSTDIRRE